MTKTSLCLVVLIAIVLLQATSGCAVSFRTEGWDSGSSAGWVQNTTKSNVGIVETGGNPGGYLRSWGADLGNDSLDIGARTSYGPSVDFTGNYLEAGVTGVSVDIRFISGSFDGAWIRFRYRDATQNGWVYSLTSTYQTDWQTFSVGFVPDWTDDEARAAGWLPDDEVIPGAGLSASFQETMADVYTAEVRISGVGDVEVGIDNFGLFGPTEVEIDIKPGTCPNLLKIMSMGVLHVAILGTAEFDITAIDEASIRLAGVSPIRGSIEDVATPVSDGADECECTIEGPDGYLDLTLMFETQEIVAALGEVNDGDILPLTLTGLLFDGISIEGADCVVIH